MGPSRNVFAQITLIPTRCRRFMILVWVEVLCFLSTGILFGLYNLSVQLEADSDLPFTVAFLAGMITPGALAGRALDPTSVRGGAGRCYAGRADHPREPLDDPLPRLGATSVPASATLIHRRAGAELRSPDRVAQIYGDRALSPLGGAEPNSWNRPTLDGRFEGGRYCEGALPPIRTTFSATVPQYPHSSQRWWSQSVAAMRRRNPFGNASLSMTTSPSLREGVPQGFDHLRNRSAGREDR